MNEATLAAGCFWGVEVAFKRLPGILSVEVGYTGGTTANPTYQEVCSGTTGHAEAVRLSYDPTMLSYEDILNHFWQIHDPTSKDRQGPDVGSQYRSIIFFHTPEQQKIAEQSKQEYAAKLKRPVVTEIVPASLFYRAEEYHQCYLQKHGRA